MALRLPLPEHDPGQAALDEELRAQIVQALATLSPALRIVVILRDLAELSTEATATQIGITPGAVRVRLHRAHLHLRQRLAGYVEFPAEERP